FDEAWVSGWNWSSPETLPAGLSQAPEGTTICGRPSPHLVVPQARTHVIIIQSNIRGVEKDCHDHKYTSFTLVLQSCRGKRRQIPHPGSALGR
ncbi:hypothetical protein KUCAC02_021282, partial [Chaenocephalus aceratus]